jgi:hypothetical protein
MGLDGQERTLFVRNFEQDTREYQKGSIGEMNGMNHPDILLDNNMDVNELKKYVK